MRFASETWRRRRRQRPFPLFTTCWFSLSMTLFHFLFDDVNVLCNSDSLVFASCRMCQTRTLFIYASFVFLYTAAGALSCVGTQCDVSPPPSRHSSMCSFSLAFFALIWFSTTQTCTPGEWSSTHTGGGGGICPISVNLLYVFDYCPEVCST